MKNGIRRPAITSSAMFSDLCMTDPLYVSSAKMYENRASDTEMDPAPTQSSSEVSLDHTFCPAPSLGVEGEGIANQASMNTATLIPVNMLQKVMSVESEVVFTQ